MFVSAQTPAQPSGAELRALRLSLNSPVVALDALPVGPASAAIALHAVAAGRPRITIALRSLRGGDRVFYAEREGRDAAHGPDLLLDAALSFAESLGFLFDDDEVETRGDDGPREAARIWQEFAGIGEPSAPGPGPSTRLGEVANSEARLEEPAEPADRRPQAPAACGPPLSKFRRRIPPAAARAAIPEPRIQLLSRF